jgi:hypothetical protein
MRILILVLLFSQVAFSQPESVQQKLKDLSWLEGTWNRTNVKPGRAAHERWVRTENNDLQGWGVSMNGSDTSFVEKIRIALKDNELNYVADVPENKEPIYFKFTELTATGFVCENPTHDFPKKISYRLDGKNLKATISGDGKSMDYLFVKKD